MKRLSNIQLIPVIHLMAIDFGKNYSYPSTKAERHEHWKKVISEFGIGDLEPIELGYEYVKITDIGDDALTKLILMRLNGIDDNDNEEEDALPSINLLSKSKLESINNLLVEIETVEILEAEIEIEIEEELPTSFEGGIVMLCDGEIFLTPQCCVSLQDY